MKKIRYIYVILLIAILALPQFSCNYLDMPLISTSINKDSIFSKRINAEQFLWDTYATIMPFGIPKYTNVYNVPGKGVYDLDQIERGIRAAITDECNLSTGYAPTTEMNLVGYSAINPRHVETKFNCCYIGIRKAFTFIENIDMAKDISQEEKDQMKSECKTLIALRYFTLIRTFGGVPLVKRALEVNEDFNISRSSLQECIDYIVQLCDESMNLPDFYDTRWRGRVTKGVALAVKARTLLYAASPLFNSAEPVIGYGNSTHNSYLCLNGYDHKRWKAAYEANLAVIDWARDYGHVSMVNTGNPFDDYGNATSTRDNSEVLLANKVIVGQTGFTTHYLPRLSNFNKGNSILVNSLSKFYKADGTDQIWPALNEVRDFSDYVTRMHEMEPRFRVMAWVFGEKPAMCPDRYNWDYIVTGEKSGDIQGAAVMMKYTYKYQGQTDMDFPIFRLAEIYLNYAEALNEYTPNSSLAYEALNVVRQRAGLPPILETDPRYKTQEAFRQLVHRERDIELFGEDHRIYDVRRWKIAHKPGIIGGPMVGFLLETNNEKNNYTTYKPFVFEERFWSDKMYYHPFPQAEVNKGYILQNPGY